ncbi:MAG: hypothetical protein GDA41_09935 [Rhodospirillales bacterium]|nr:hypothetical protein [Rhodospirillales bacterium]
MHRRLIAETTLAGLRPLGMGSRRIQDSWNEIDSYLRNRLGASYADLFAEPVQGAHGVSWFGAPEGEVKPYAELDNEAKAALLEEMQRRSETIRAHAETLAQSRRDSDRRLAQTLQWALVVPEAKPSRDFLYSASGEPLLINWGTRDENAQASDSALQEFLTGEAWQLRRAKEAAAVPVHREPVAVREVATGHSLWWLLWLLFGLSIAGIMYLLLLGCGLRLPFGLERPAFLNSCPGALAASDPGQEQLRQERDRGRGLARQILLLQRDLARRQRCPLDIARTEEAPSPSQEESQAAFDAIREEGAEEGAVEIILEWQGDADLDLHVICPDGSRVFFHNPNNTSCGAILDVDANRSARDLKEMPREHVTWPQSPGPGRYRIFVDNFEGRSRGRSTPVPYKVYLSRGGEVDVYEGQIAEAGGIALVQEVTLP